mgnify:CR=1 FL=1
MEQLYLIVISIATLLNALLAIFSFISKIKKPVDNVVDKKFERALEPLNAKLDDIDKRIDGLDKSECKNYLTEFIEDVKNGVVKSDIQIQRATEVYDHYRKDLHGNSYIHDGWQKYVKI